MNEAKIRLSDSERELVSDASWILTKNRIMEKGMQLLGALHPAYVSCLTRHPQLPVETVQSTPKISRGENYKGLPWLVLDYPRLFGKQDQFAVRTMFWWGHFFSITLQVAGCYKSQFEKNIIRSFPVWAGAGYAVCVHDNPWQHHFAPDNYRALDKMDPGLFTQICQSKDFIKIALSFPVSAWDQANEILAGEFGRLMKGLED